MQDPSNILDDIPRDYPFRIKSLRSRLGLTQAELAKRIGVSVLTVNRWENEQTQPLRVAWKRLLALEEPGPASRRSTPPPAADNADHSIAAESDIAPDVQTEMRGFHRRFASSAWAMLRSFERRLGDVADTAARLKDELLAARSDAGASNEPTRSIAIYVELDVLMPGVSRWHLYVMGWLRRFFSDRGLANHVYIGRREYQMIAEAGIPPELLNPTCTEFIDAVDHDRVAAVLAISTPPHARWVQPLRRRGVPIIGASSEFEHHISLDIAGGLNTAIDYFQSLGRRRIALIHWSGYPGAHHGGDRVGRFVQSLQQRGLPVRPQWIRGDLHPTATGAGWEEFREVWSAGREKPDALIVADDCLLPDVDAAIGDMNICVPDQLAVVGFTNRHIIMPTRLHMARLEADPQAYAQAMGHMSLDVLAGRPSLPRHQALPLQWIPPVEHGDLHQSPRPGHTPAAPVAPQTK